MNLTSKRALQFLTMCAGVCALSASAQTTWVADNFEPEGDGYTNAAIGSAASDYKMLVWGGGMNNSYTNIAWGATAGDASTIQTNTDTYAGGIVTPMESSTDTQYLKLETEGQTLTRYIDFLVTNNVEGVDQTMPTNISFATTPVYVDTLIKFTPSEDAPEISDPNVKIAIYVNVNSNLVVNHQYYDGTDLIPTNSVFEGLGALDPNTWHRLTIKATTAFGGLASVFQIWMDGTLLDHANGALDDETFTGGSILFSLVQTADMTQISFQGTGAVDELVVSDITPDFSTTTGVLLTLSYDESKMSVTFGGSPVASNATVTAGSEIIIDAIDWYEIASVTGSGDATYVGNPTPGSQVNVSTGTVSATAAETITITANQYTGTIDTGFGSSVDATKLSQWAIANSKSEAEVVANAANWYDDYLLNVAPDTDATLEIQSIAYDSGTGDSTIVVGSAGDEVPMNDLNGSLIIKTATSLSGPWGTPAVTTNSLTATAMEVAVPTGGNFMKATVE